MPEQVRRFAPSGGGSLPDDSGGGRRGRGRGGGRRRRGGGGGGGGGIDLSSLLGGGSPLNALLSRYGEMMDIGLESARAEAPRQAKAFDLFTQGKESELEEADLRRTMARKESKYARQRELAAGKEKRTAATSARERGRAATKAQHDRETALQTRYNPMDAGIYSGVDFGSTVSPWTRQARGF